jgi:hypothetical protein
MNPEGRMSRLNLYAIINDRSYAVDGFCTLQGGRIVTVTASIRPDSVLFWAQLLQLRNT